MKFAKLMMAAAVAAGTMFVVTGCGKSPEQEFQLGLAYSQGSDGREINFAEAVKHYQKAANRGFVPAQYELAVCYQKGQGVKKDPEEAVKWFKKAAENGYLYAQSKLGEIFSQGNGVKQNYEEAMKWYRKAADQNDCDAICAIGIFYDKGLGVSENSAEAAEWFKKAAEQGSAYANLMLGRYYLNGKGVKKDQDKATKYFESAAKLGNTEAQVYMGLWSEDQAKKTALRAHDAQQEFNKSGLTSDYKTWEFWRKCMERYYGDIFMYFKMAAEKGDPVGTRLLGDCYRDGTGVKKNLDEAVKLYRIAAEKGDETARNNLKALNK